MTRGDVRARILDLTEEVSDLASLMTEAHPDLSPDDKLAMEYSMLHVAEAGVQLTYAKLALDTR